MRLKFYISFIFLLFICAAKGQYGIWKPVTKNALEFPFNYNVQKVFAAKDSNNLYFLIPNDMGWHDAKLVKTDGQNITVYDTINLDSIYYSPMMYNLKMVLYKNDFYFYDNRNLSGGDTSTDVMWRLGRVEGGEKFIKYEYRDSTRYNFNERDISDVIVYKNELYAIGNMTGLDSLPCHGIARYDGTAWHTLGTGTSEGLPNDVYSGFNPVSLKVFNDKLYILAYYYDSSSQSGFSDEHFLACWDGTNWLFKKHLSPRTELFESLYIIDNKLYTMQKYTDTLRLFEVIDSTISVNHIEDKNLGRYWYLSDIDGKLWNVSRSVTIIDTNSVYQAPQYYIESQYGDLDYISFKNKMYAYGLFDAITGNRDTLKWVAETDAKMNKVSGRIYYDNDSNCNYGKGDEQGNNELLKLTPGPTYANTDETGKYNLLVSSDSVSIEPVQKNYRKINSCSPKKYTLFANDTISHNHIDFSLGKEILVNDLAIKLDGYTGWRARRGFTEWYSINVKNNGTLKDSGILRLYYSDKIQIKSTNPQADSITSTWAQWNIPAIDLNRDINIEFTAHIDTTYHNGDTLLIYAQMVNQNDHYISDNYDTLTQEIRSSLDPNSMQVFTTGQDSEIHILSPSQRQLQYLVHFENTGNDTAYNITVVDTLDGRLDMSSFELVSKSHQVIYKILPYEPQTGSHLLKFSFNNILLPPKDTLQTNQSDNGGFFSYKIKLKNNLPIGTEISNRAYIYFDYNSAVETNTAIVRIDTTIANGISNPIYYNKSEGLYYWPVPSSDKLFIMNLLNQKQQLEVYNIEGKKLMIHSLNANETSSISLDNFPSGMYFMRSLSDVGRVYKFVKN